MDEISKDQIRSKDMDNPQDAAAAGRLTPFLDLLCSPDYVLSLKGLIKMASDIATDWTGYKNRGLLYRDIQIRNICCAGDGTFKLRESGSCIDHPLRRGLIGNRWFMAPEDLTSGNFQEVSAVYSISMVMYFIMNGLHPAFWSPGSEEYAIYQRLNGYSMPLPSGCRDLPAEIREKVDEFFKKTSAVIPNLRTCSMAGLTDELDRLLEACGGNDYIIHRDGSPLDFDLDAGNMDRMYSGHMYGTAACASFPCPPASACQPATEVTFVPGIPEESRPKGTLWDKLFGNRCQEVYSSVFAPAEVRRGSHMTVQVYLHLYGDSEKVKALAQESDQNAERRDYLPLSVKLKKGDKVDVVFNIYGKSLLASGRKSLIWQGSFTKCSFSYFVPGDIGTGELRCDVTVYANGAAPGEMSFITRIAETPRNVNPKIMSRRFNRIFISYAHQDASQIKYLAMAYKAQGADYFYDRDSLAAGDVYEEKIFDYIDSSDLFILCWSRNAAASDYVTKERQRALLHAYPHLSRKDATLKICPISIEPRAELPDDMKDVYNFEVI